MREKEGKKEHGRMIPAALAAVVCCVILLAVFLVPQVSGRNRSRLENLLLFEGWKAETAKGMLSDVRLPGFLKTAAGTPVVLRARLPRALESGTCLAFETNGQHFEVYVDGELIRESEKNLRYDCVTCWNLVSLESIYAEGQMMLVFTGTDPYDAGILPKFYLGPEPEILMYISESSALNRYISISILILGLLVFLFSAVTFSSSRFVSEFFILGFFIVFLGISLLWRIPQVPDGFLPVFVRQTVSAACFGILPALYCLYRQRQTEEGQRKAYRILQRWYTVFFAALFVCRTFLPGRAGFPWRFVRCALMEAAYGFCLYFLLAKEKQESKLKVMTAAGLLVMMFVTGLSGFTHAAIVFELPVSPMVAGGLAFSLLQIVSVVFSAYDYVDQQLKMAGELSESRVKLMAGQIQPHFLRSALGAIRIIIKRDPDKAYRLIYDFTNYLSYNMDNIDSLELIPFKTELQHIREFAAIEEERFRPRVETVYDIGPEDFKVPHLSIQPFVENAIVHGALSRRQGGIVRVSTAETEEAYQVRIEDNGYGFDTENPKKPRPGHGVGMKNAVTRLELMAGAKVAVESSKEEGTKVTVTVPKQKEDSGK